MNVMEQIVEEFIRRYEDELKLPCTCETTLRDVQALALNHVQPKYVTDPNSSVYIRAAIEGDPQEVTKLLSVVTRAAQQVARQPRCTCAQHSPSTAGDGEC